MLHFSTYGQGKPVVFLHGFLLDSQGWSFFRPDEAQFQSIFIDLPGHGRSSEFLPGSFGLNGYAEAVIEVLKFLNIQSYDLVGHSMGGYIGLQLLQSEFPPDKLILFHSNHWADSEERRLNRDRVGPVVQQNQRLFLRESIPLLFHQAERHAESIEQIVERATKMTPEAIIHAAQSMKIRPDLADVVANNSSRCWLIQGANDKLIPEEESLHAWSGMPQHVVVVEQCGHMGHLEQTDVCRAHIEVILKQKTEN
jgi:pimeloyl-ACP methyl ester carboxylesterase